MKDCQRTKLLDLVPDEMLRLIDATGTVVRVNRGQVWLTQDRDSRDIVLEPGDSWMIERGGLTVVQAQKSSSLTVTGSGAMQADRRMAKSPLYARVADWLARAGTLLERQRAPYF